MQPQHIIGAVKMLGEETLIKGTHDVLGTIYNVLYFFVLYGTTLGWAQQCNNIRGKSGSVVESNAGGGGGGMAWQYVLAGWTCLLGHSE